MLVRTKGCIDLVGVDYGREGVYKCAYFKNTSYAGLLVDREGLGRRRHRRCCR